MAPAPSAWFVPPVSTRFGTVWWATQLRSDAVGRDTPVGYTTNDRQGRITYIDVGSGDRDILENLPQLGGYLLPHAAGVGRDIPSAGESSSRDHEWQSASNRENEQPPPCPPRKRGREKRARTRPSSLRL